MIKKNISFTKKRMKLLIRRFRKKLKNMKVKENPLLKNPKFWKKSIKNLTLSIQINFKNFKIKLK